jgi:hypothetical protein
METVTRPSKRTFDETETNRDFRREKNMGQREETDQNRELREERHLREDKETENKEEQDRKKVKLLESIEKKGLVESLEEIYDYRFDSLIDEIVRVRRFKDMGMKECQAKRKLEKLIFEYESLLNKN